MNYTNLYLQIALTELRGIGPRKAKLLLDYVPNIEDIFTLPLKEIFLQTGITVSTLSKMDRDGALRSAETILQHCESLELTPLFYTDPRYSRRLKQCDDAPLIIYTKGEMDLNTARFVSIVGTRTPSEEGYQKCRDLVEGLSEAGVVVVSGLAYGIDVCAHKTSMENNLPTIAVLAHGLERIYPSHHRKIAHQMLGNGGLLTEYAPHAHVDKENFPMRNRIVAGMCDATIVVESKSRGGSLITADLANDYNREVFAYPGSVYNEFASGCNDLIAENKATLLRGPEDLLNRMGWENNRMKEVKQLSLFNTLSEQERQLIEVLHRTSAIHIDHLMEELRYSIADLNVILFQLEMEGLIRPLPGNRYQLA